MKIENNAKLSVKSMVRLTGIPIPLMMSMMGWENSLFQLIKSNPVQIWIFNVLEGNNVLNK